MFYRQASDQYINEGTAFEVDGVQYPANWLNLSTPEEKTALGLEEVVIVGERKDDRYYWITEALSGATLTITNTPKDLETVRASCIAALKQTAYSLLAPSDWMVTRKIENGTPLPSDWATYREAVRLECEGSVVDANAATSVDEIAAIVPSWPVSPDAIIPAPAVSE